MEETIFHQEWLDCLIADYKVAVIDHDIPQEASLKHIMLDAGLSDEQIDTAREQGIEYLGLQDEAAQEYLSELEKNVYIPILTGKDAKKQKAKKTADDSDLLSGAKILNHWDWGEVSKRTNQPALPEVPVMDGYDHVFVGNSKLIHLCLAGKNKTRCGKKVGQTVEPENVYNPMYSFCPKCRRV